MTCAPDALTAYVTDRSHDAFAQIVRDFGGMVHAAARRQVGDAHLAEDVTQAVFILLARRAHTIRSSQQIPGWLIKTTYFVSRDALKQKWRREKHEKKAATMTPAQMTVDSHSEQIEQIQKFLDAALARLRGRDRDLIVSRFLRGQSLVELSTAMNASEGSIRKRLERALAKLREHLSRNGVHAAPPTLAAAFAASKGEAIPAAMAHYIVSAATGAAGSAPGAAILAKHALQHFFRTKLLATSASGAGIVVGAIIVWAIFGGSRNTIAPPAAPIKPTPIAAAPIIRSQWAPEQLPPVAGYPIEKGWPIALPGSITGTPAVADLEGNGKLAIIVPCEYINDPVVHSHPTQSVLLYAFHADGTAVPGWPVELVTPAARDRRESTGNYTSSWSSSPSVCIDSHGKPRVVITTPYFLGIRVITPDGKLKTYRGGSQWSTVPLVDIDGDGVPDIITGAAILNIDGGPAGKWDPKHPIARRSGFAPAIGDPNNDGKLQVFHVFYTGNALTDLIGYDATGNELPNWHKQLDGKRTFNPAPIMGDVGGDGKMEIVACAIDKLYAWSADGTPAPGTHEQPPLAGILRNDVHSFHASPSLADIDGDGKAEIILYDGAMHALRAFHGDGKGVGANDGILAMPLDGQADGVSVANLSGDGTTDFFVGSNWIHYDPRTDKATVKAMLPESAVMNTTQPTLCDIDGDGKTEVLFGLTDGRLFIYRTELPYRPEAMQWPTVSGNFQHTGVWRSPAIRR
jgi:RNA polymerase sigma factor (sigma-70 family)